MYFLFRFSSSADILSRELREILMKRYKRQKLHLKPWDPKSFTSFDDLLVRIAVHVKQPDERGTTTKKIPLEQPGDIFTVEVDGLIASHILLLAAAGHGKTTALAKFAHDWANQVPGSPLNKFRYLFLLILRGAKKDSSLGEVIIAQLLRGMKGITPAGIENFIRKNQRRCCFLLDGYDEFSGSIVLQVPSSNSLPHLAELILGEDFPECQVVVTSRHYRKDEFERGELPKMYAQMEIEGFAEEDVKTYISKFFHKVPQKGEELIGYINTQHSLASLANVPFFCMALCNMKEGNVLKDTDTLTKLFKQLIVYLVNHARARNESGNFSEDRVNSMVNAVGEVALKKLTDSNQHNLIFSRADFAQCSCDLERCLQIGLLSKEEFAYDHPVDFSEEVHAARIMFFHKLAQEYTAGIYLAGLEQHMMKNVLCKLNSIDKVLALENVLHFVAGSSPDSLIPIAEHMNAVWEEKGSIDSQRLLFHHLSESTESVRGALTSLLTPHFLDGLIVIKSDTGKAIMGLINLPSEIKSMVR